MVTSYSAQSDATLVTIKNIEKPEFSVLLKHCFIVVEGHMKQLLKKTLKKSTKSLWVPRLLTVDQKPQRFVDSQAYFELFRRNTKNVLHRYVTIDVTCRHILHRSQNGNHLSGQFSGW